MLADGSDLELFAIGVEDAPDHYTVLSSLWCGLLKWLAGTRTARVFASDKVWDTQKNGWVDLGQAAENGLINAERLVPVKAGTSTLYTAEMGGRELCSLVERWWPSGLGWLAGMASVEGHALSDGGLTPQPVIDRNRLVHLHHHFQTSRAFDNLGLIVISRETPWHELTRQLSALGWELIAGEALGTPPVLPLIFRRGDPDSRPT